MNFSISATTDIGTKRKVNQDSLFVRKLTTRIGKMVFAVLCDGMGGYQYGEVASALLIGSFTDWMYRELPVLTQRPLEDQIIRKEWGNIIIRQNEKIRSYGDSNNCTVGSTVTALLLTQSRYFLLNIGDTRAYEISKEVVQLTVDHTMIEKEIQLGNMTKEQAESSPVRNVLTRCVGVEKSVYPDMFFGEVQKNAVYMLCSDGFRHHITIDEIREHLWLKRKKDTAGMKHQEEYLIELNKQRGESDNISVITIGTY